MNKFWRFNNLTTPSSKETQTLAQRTNRTGQMQMLLPVGMQGTWALLPVRLQALPLLQIHVIGIPTFPPQTTCLWPKALLIESTSENGINSSKYHKTYHFSMAPGNSLMKCRANDPLANHAATLEDSLNMYRIMSAGSEHEAIMVNFSKYIIAQCWEKMFHQISHWSSRAMFWWLLKTDLAKVQAFYNKCYHDGKFSPSKWNDSRHHCWQIQIGSRISSNECLHFPSTIQTFPN